MHLKSNALYVVCLGKGAGLLPVGDQNLVPLPVQNLEEVLGPRAGYPVRILGIRRVTGTAGEGDHGVHAQLLRQQNALAEIGVECFGDSLVGMNRVAVAGQSADLKTVFLKKTLELGQLGLVVQQNVGIAVCLAGITAAADLHRFNAHGLELRQYVLQRTAAVQIGKYTKFHNTISSG